MNSIWSIASFVMEHLHFHHLHFFSLLSSSTSFHPIPTLPFLLSSHCCLSKSPRAIPVSSEAFNACAYHVPIRCAFEVTVGNIVQILVLHFLNASEKHHDAFIDFHEHSELQHLTWSVPTPYRSPPPRTSSHGLREDPRLQRHTPTR